MLPCCCEAGLLLLEEGAFGKRRLPASCGVERGVGEEEGAEVEQHSVGLAVRSSVSDQVLV